MITRRKTALAAVLTLFVAACSLPSITRAFSMGAPESSCSNMMPGHGVEPQSTPSPFKISLSPWEDKNGRRLVNVTLDGGIEFAGFLLQARPDNSGNAIGAFVVDTSVSKTHTCGSGLRNSVTHNKNTLKNKVDLVWEAPEDFVGIVAFHATFVRDYSTFWTNVRSEKFRINKRSTDGSPGVETTSRKPTTRLSTTPKPVPKTTQAVLSTRSQQVAEQTAMVYEGCNSLKNCFGLPENCVESRTCTGLVTYVRKADKYEFELYGRGENLVWVGTALSDDQVMAEDSVNECVYENGRVNLYHSWNEPAGARKGNRRSELDGMVELNASYVDGAVYCKYQRPEKSVVEGKTFDLSVPHFLFVAAGNQLKEASVGYHDLGRIYSANKINLSDISVVEAASEILVRLHGAFMLAAWIGAASTGILLARYFKLTWVGSQLCGKDQWFAWHRMLMVLTWCLTVAAFILIFVELGTWSKENNPHAILGVITTALAFIQPFMAALRPAPTARRRPIFNWLHWLVGNLAHIFAIVTIFFAVLLPRAKLPEWMNWILVAFVAFHVFMHLLFSIAGCASERANSARVTSFPMKDMGASRSPLHGKPDRKSDASYTTLRKVLLAFYIIGVFGLAIVLIVITVLAPIENWWKGFKTTVGM